MIAETKRECLGEGDIKFMELRAGKFVELGKAMRAELKTVIAGLEKDGYYTFANGRTISNYIWTKMVDLSGNGKAQITFNRDEAPSTMSPSKVSSSTSTRRAPRLQPLRLMVMSRPTGALTW